MPVYYGNTELGRDYYASSPQGKIYQGSNLVQNGTETFSAEYLLLGGGGGGGYVNAGGGGGGQFISGSVIINPLTNYDITIGEGGIGGTGSIGSNGSSSLFGIPFFTITALGGGKGGASNTSGSNGASGGGGGGNGFAGGTGSVGFNGGNGFVQDEFDPAGGGGGAGSRGVNGASLTAGNGGSGSFSSITGTSIEYCGGGGGGIQRNSGTVGVGRGGGGNGGRAGGLPISASAGSPNTGGGGGGGGGTDGGADVYARGGKGGSGVLILRYTNSYSASLSSGLTFTIATTGSEKILSVTSGSGTINFAAAAAGDVDATAYLAAVVAAGGSVDATITSAVDTLFTSLKSNSLYTKIDVMYPFVGGVGASNAINAKLNATFDITWYGGMTFNTSGAIGNGTNGYGDTHFNASASANPLDYSWGVYMNNQGNFGGEIYINGAYDGTNLSTIRGDTATSIGLYGYNVGLRSNITITSDNRGLYIATFNSTGSTGKSLYYNYNSASPVSGVFNSGTPAVLSNQPIYTHVLNINGAPYAGNYCSATTSFLYFGKSLTSGEVTTLSTIINTFQTSLGRNTYS